MDCTLSSELVNILNSRNIIFKKAEAEDLDEVIGLFKERITWFKTSGINQWSKYLEHHPKEEFRNAIEAGYYFLLKQNNKIIAGFELSVDSRLWQDNFTNAYYIYKIVTKVNYKNLGNLIFLICRNIAENNNQRFLRLDCLKSNIKLNQIYEKHGFILKSTGCKDYYQYALREYDLYKK